MMHSLHLEDAYESLLSLSTTGASSYYNSLQAVTLSPTLATSITYHDNNSQPTSSRFGESTNYTYPNKL